MLALRPYATCMAWPATCTNSGSGQDEEVADAKKRGSSEMADVKSSLLAATIKRG